MWVYFPQSFSQAQSFQRGILVMCKVNILAVSSLHLPNWLRLQKSSFTVINITLPHASKKKYLLQSIAIKETDRDRNIDGDETRDLHLLTVFSEYVTGQLLIVKYCISKCSLRNCLERESHFQWCRRQNEVWGCSLLSYTEGECNELQGYQWDHAGCTQLDMATNFAYRAKVEGQWNCPYAQSCRNNLWDQWSFFFFFNSEDNEWLE